MRRLSALAAPIAAALAVSFAVAAPAIAAGTSYTWIGSSGNSGGNNHSWTDAHNWSPTGIPGDGDSVSINSPDPAHCTAAVDGIPATALANLSIAQDPTRCGVSINGDGTTGLTVTGSFTWDGGAINGVPVTLNAGTTGTISGSNQRLNSLAADLTVAGTLTMTEVSGSGATDASLRITNPYHLHIAAGGTLVSSGDNNVEFLSCCNNPAKVVNDGTLEVDGGDLTVTAVEVDQNGTLSAANGGRLVTQSAPVTAASGATYTGSGGWFVENGARANLSGTQTLGPDFRLELGGLDVAAGADLGGTATFAGTGTIAWTGGTIEGNFTIGHGVRLVASGVHINNGRRLLLGQDALNGYAASTLTNHGTMVFANGASIGTGGPAHLVNASDGTISIAPGVVFASGSCCVNPDQFVNHGTVTVPTGTATAAAELDEIAYKSTGTTTVAAGRQLLLSGQAPGALSGAALTGAGSLAVATPMSVSGTNTVGAHAALVLSTGGSLNGTSTIAGPGALDWTGGSFSGAVTVAVGGGTTVTGADQKTIANVNGGPTTSKLTFTSHLSVASGTAAHHVGIDLGRSTLTLGSSTAVGNHVDLYGGKLVNSGTLTVKPGMLERDGSPSTVNQGTVVLTAGATFESSGTFTQSSGGTLSEHLGSQAHGELSVSAVVALHGKLRAIDDGSYNPAVGKKVQVVASPDVTASPGCVITSGAGSASRHWVAGVSATGLVLIRKPGAHLHC